LALYQTTPRWLAVFWLSFGATLALEYWISARDRATARGEYKDRGSIFIVVAMVWLGLFAAYFAPYVARWARIALPPAPMFWSAIALIWAGIALRIWSVLTLGKFYRLQVFILAGHQLVTSGPYRLVRHPSYAGGLLTVTGIGLAMGNWLSVAVAFLCLFVGYAMRIVIEEQALRAHFGTAFEAYKRHTWALIPLLW
jgi:protein-S-isoprenylcysteine O-methyltransferase